jgi:alkanesulfonate monooxygenase SsuD/methylene tetrahydromethanopterin reductase-like flavin-dependent oxidoreductase (luciferase family)
MEKAQEKARKAYPDADWAKEEKGLLGTPESIRQDIYRYRDAGVDMVILSFLGGEWEKEITLFREEVVSNL